MAIRILVVDDSRVVARQLEHLFAGEDSLEIVGWAENGAEALAVYAEERPDVVLMDIVMPTMDGLQALRAILAMDGEARVVMLSSVGGTADKASEALRMGARAVVPKPIDRDEILAALAAVAGRGR